MGYFKTFFLLLLSIPPFIVIFQNKLLFSCSNTHQLFLPQAFGLPTAYYLNGRSVIFPKNSTRTLYYFHGNGASIQHVYWQIGQIYSVCDCTIVALEDLECVDSTLLGHRWSFKNEKTVKLMIEKISKNTKHQNILMGSSLGTSYLLMAYQSLPNLISKIILENPPTSIPKILKYIPNFLFYEQWDNLDVISKITKHTDTLFLTSEKDGIVPPVMSKELFERCSSKNKKHVLLSGASHGDATAHPQFLPSIKEFLDS
jgi:pimeloyl-ACP methyl ester carboxylesterase